MIVLLFIYYFILTVMIISANWLFLLTCFSWFYQPKKDKQAPLLRLGVLIPAHNEETGIGRTLDTLSFISYPAELLQIFVLADNCSDNTSFAAIRDGVLVVERVEPELAGKGAALNWFLTKRQDLYEDLDGLVFIDADSRPDKNMFKELSASLSHPEVAVVQGFNSVANGQKNYRTALLEAAFNVFNHLRMAGSCRLFGSAPLKGLGMAFRIKIVKKYGWPATSMVEDQELSLLLEQDNIAVHYNPQAIIRSAMESDAAVAEKQRVRWEGGRFGLTEKYAPVFISKICKGQWRFFPPLMELIIPPLSLLVFCNGLLAVLAYVLFPSTLLVVVIIAIELGLYVVSGQLQRGLSLKGWVYLLTAPLFIIWKLSIYIKLLFSTKRITWGRIKRDE